MSIYSGIHISEVDDRIEGMMKKWGLFFWYTNVLEQNKKKFKNFEFDRLRCQSIWIDSVWGVRNPHTHTSLQNNLFVLNYFIIFI